MFVCKCHVQVQAFSTPQHIEGSQEHEHVSGLLILLEVSLKLALFFLLAGFVDMFLGLMVVAFAMCLVWGERRWWVAGLVALLTPGLIFITFDALLEVRFPRGILTNLYYG